jgi:hypothetical protein
MKKKSCLALVAIFSMSVLLLAQETIKTVVLEIPDDPAAAKNKLLLNMSQLQLLATELTFAVQAADIELLNMQDVSLVSLGSVKKGKIKWNFKIIGDKFLAVDFSAADYALLCEKIKNKAIRPGFQLTVIDGKTRAIIKSQEVTFCDFADMAVQLSYPVQATPGQLLQSKVTVSIENKGSVAAKNIVMEIILSSDNKFQQKNAVVSDQFVENVRLGDGREIIPLLEAGQQLIVNFSGTLKIPADTPPGKYYLAVIVDPENQISEINKDNNIDSGFILLSVPEPAAFTLEMPETALTFEPATYGLKIMHQETILSDGKDWKLCKMKPNLYQIKHVSWSGFFWEIDTFEKAIWEVKGADFCKKGGKSRNLDIKIDVKGGSLLIPPSSFTLKLARTQMRFEPATKKFTLLAYGNPIYHLPFWWVCKRESHLYQIRFTLWENFFWQVDTFKKQVSQISGVNFCSVGGTASPLSMQVTVEK